MKRKKILLHIGIWLAYLVYSLADTYFKGYKQDSWLDNYYWDFSYVTVQAVQFYFCYFWVFPKFMKLGKLPQLIGGIILALLLFQVSRYLLEQFLSYHWFGKTNFRGNFSLTGMILTNVYYGTWMIGICAAIYATQRYFEQQRLNGMLQEEATKAELSFLKNQINPHFLYNSLNYIYSLAIPLSEQLSDAVLKLSDMMRYTLKEHPDGMVNLIQEWQYIQDYVSFFRLRFDPQFCVKLEAEGIQDQRIATLLLIPFVENAFKHGAVDDPKQPVKIKLNVVKNKLTFTVSNRISQKEKDPSSGIGLINVERRLKLIYPDRHELLISTNGRTYKTTLTMLL